MSVIGSLFGHSPIRPMQAHMKAATRCAKVIVPFFEAMAQGDVEAMTRLSEEVDRLEHEADELKNEIRSRLPQRLFMAVERRDMLDLLDHQDSIDRGVENLGKEGGNRRVFRRAVVVPLAHLLEEGPAEPLGVELDAVHRGHHAPLRYRIGRRRCSHRPR